MRDSESVEVTENGIVCRKNGGVSWSIAWEEIRSIETYKLDLFVHDDVCIEIEVSERRYVIDETTRGWDALTRAIAERFPIPPDWFETVVQPPFAPSRRLLWARDA